MEFSQNVNRILWISKFFDIYKKMKKKIFIFSILIMAITVVGFGFPTNIFSEKEFFQGENKSDITEAKLQKKYQKAGQTIKQNYKLESEFYQTSRRQKRNSNRNRR